MLRADFLDYGRCQPPRRGCATQMPGATLCRLWSCPRGRGWGGDLREDAIRCRPSPADASLAQPPTTAGRPSRKPHGCLL